MQRTVAALSLRDGRVVADPFTPTAELVELMRLRARQITLRLALAQSRHSVTAVWAG